jgi:hypothetical protein
MIQAADEGRGIRRKAAMAGLAHVGIHVAAFEERPVGGGTASHQTQIGPTRSSREKKPGPPALNEAIASASNFVIGLDDAWIGAKSPLLTSRINGLPSKKRFEIARELMRAFCGVVVRNSSNSAASVRERCVAATACESAMAAADGCPVRPPAAIRGAVPATHARRTANTATLRLLMYIAISILR